MNTKNNKRRLQSRETMEAAFIQLLQTRELSQITVSELCQQAQVNRSTFYANYTDIYALADVLRDRLEQEVAQLYEGESASKFHSPNWVQLFRHMQENQLFYKTYFKLGYDHQHQVNLSDFQSPYAIFPAEQMEYHIAFFKAGFNAMVKKWLQDGCKETPEEMNEILRWEYRGRTI